MPFDPTQLAQAAPSFAAGAAVVLATVASLFVLGKIGPMSLVDRAETRADAATALASKIVENDAGKTEAIRALTTELRESRLRGG